MGFLTASLRRLYSDGFTAGGPVSSPWWSGPKSEEPISGYYSDSGYAIIYTPDHPEGVVVENPQSSYLPGTGIPPLPGSYIESNY
mmetsp:Transcript_15628/g.30860  ORF Transcript_15628/g.30860 Transcript_15628/m.30860 type:complete len:85 (+) Transcript_15628:268-522(+)|eukprot:CAMPEP_0173393354 /NCGR_PEP_ID=MMETSP1356-20130122/22063_1 /TAXON_ID=77927 ORGANISM="Hemiselmis virescens, Strain PCC157" /NCGR_SAMPLE_ID=MMETSP1356 /ASSEMBLY_ACC=CAM_ASM_000847 /LENGTH=84 /DNA_ID=CAMNT_0014351361 /DNA_START=233 /DNA_END=487 /DNA_ORIENTATION=-